MEKLLTTKEAADMLGLKANTLERWRTFGTGPAYERVGNAIRYRPSDIESWLKSRKRKRP